MPMKAPVIAMTGMERTPTSYIRGKSRRMFFQRSHQLDIQRRVRPAKMEKSPKAANVLLVSRPMVSIMPMGIVGGDDKSGGAARQTGDEVKGERFSIDSRIYIGLLCIGCRCKVVPRGC